ncbi:very-long-chain 3-oxoacyl-CoA reductase-A-like protein [Lates japonicus]|uniref:3-ketoacyl-CoA reductase n=1 Tax=Lates japonicus TaxID=270547 RepID=A0AAD3MU49_LATJO|nr:very-long-chain 3-oxoacyl-CoA reductase-A-like protein [Lates japonicus]
MTAPLLPPPLSPAHGGTLRSGGGQVKVDVTHTLLQMRLLYGGCRRWIKQNCSCWAARTRPIHEGLHIHTLTHAESPRAAAMNWKNVEEMIRRAETPLFWVGAFTVASLALWLLYRLLSGFRIWVLGNGQLLSPKLGKWAVVTGATDGIGKSYAEELARRGFAMMLISRSQDKLDDVAKSLEEQYKVETRTIAVDFGKTDIYSKIEAGLTGLEIGVLVNNVGVSYPYPEYYLHIPDLDNFITNMINVNMTSVCQMTRLVLPRMAERSKGVILNISSASGMYPVPLLTVYSATKAFVDFFSRGLQEEYRRQGIIIQSVLPFFVATKMTRIRKPTLDKPTPERYVAAELTTVGLQSQTNGYFPHAVMGWVTTKLVPSSIVIFLGARMNRLQRTGYLQRRKLREQRNGASLKSE